MDPAQETGYTGRKLPEAKSTARWDGDAIVMEMRTMEAPPIIGKTMMRLSADGKELFVEGTRSGRGIERTTKNVYTKTGS